MNQHVVHVGIDVDDVHYHGSVLDFRCRPNLNGLVGQLEKARVYFSGARLKLWYEASFVGFSLQRDLQDRDLLRSRERLIQQQGDLRRHLLSLLRCNGLHYKAESERKTHWRTHHYGWLTRRIEACSGSLKVNLSLLFRQLKNLDEILTA